MLEPGTIVELTKTKRGGEKLRNGVVRGKLLNSIALGKSVYVAGDPLTPGTDVRLFNTSPLIDIEEEGQEYLVVTASGSVYRIRVIADEEAEVVG